MKFFKLTAKLSLLIAAFSDFPGSSSVVAVQPKYEIQKQGVVIAGVSGRNSIIYDNDWWLDVFDNNYLWAQSSLSHADLRGNVVTRDMWDWEKGYLYKMEKCVDDAKKAIRFARDSGLKKIPDATIGSDRVIRRPASGKIEDTEAQPTDGSRLIVAEAKRASPEKPLLIMVGGPLSTVANALLTNPEIAPNVVVFTLTVASGYNATDTWATYIVARQARLVDWGYGTFWDKNSVFTAKDFETLPKNSFCDSMRRLIASDLGQSNQLGDGAALVWLWRNDCWADVKRRKAVWHGRGVSFDEVKPGEAADLIEIPKSATNLKASREEFFRVLTQPGLFTISRDLRK